MIRMLLPCLLASVCSAAAAAEHRCAADAAQQARKLLAFHVDEQDQDRMGFEPPRQMPSLKNPANPSQKLDVLEVIGYLRPHGEYRMRFSYALLPRGCVMVGQEILGMASL